MSAAAIPARALAYGLLFSAPFWLVLAGVVAVLTR